MPTAKLNRRDKRAIFEEFLNDYADESIEDLARRFKVTIRHIRRLCKDGFERDKDDAFRNCLLIGCDGDPVPEGDNLYCSSRCEIAFKSQLTGVNGVFPQEEIDAIKPYGDNYSIKDDTESDE